MSAEIELIVELPAGGALERQLRGEPPAAVVDGRVSVQAGPTDAEGNLEAQDAGEVVATVLSPEALRREHAELARVLRHAGDGAEPLVIEMEAAEELREDELEALLEGAARAPRPVILRVLRGV